MIQCLPQTGFTNLEALENEFDYFEETFLLTTNQEVKTMPTFLINTKVLQVVGKFETNQGAEAVAEKAKFSSLIVSKAKDLEGLKFPELQTLFKNLTKKDSSEKSKAKLIPEIMKVMKSIDSKAPDVKKTSNGDGAKKGGGTKVEILRQCFAEKDEWSKEDLMAKTGFDEKNIGTALAIARNAARTKPEHTLNTTYDRKEKIYRLVR